MKGDFIFYGLDSKRIQTVFGGIGGGVFREAGGFGVEEEEHLILNLVERVFGVGGLGYPARADY
ncbi:MAG: hypothetical protein M0R30_13200 [Methanoregula sp.]|uniref:hypothetical protein n=1 Tax=Methanoregula sp. TaxID=2052170 RepID=UPI0025FDE9CB|nr:hypothetical protein [Methanoregula sp.]MCK9632582.1 hypothetical protein [Methanoregula sp.]